MKPAWVADAACRGQDPGMFYPSKWDMVAATAAKAFCHANGGCPVIRECLDYALDHNQPGVWGGTSEKDRRRIKRERKGAA